MAWGGPNLSKKKELSLKNTWFLAGWAVLQPLFTVWPYEVLIAVLEQIG